MKKIENAENSKSINEIVDYSECPMIHYFKYVKGYDVEGESLNFQYISKITEVIYAMYYRVKDKELVRTEDIKAMWGTRWVTDKRKSSLVFSDTKVNRNDYGDKRLFGLKTLLNYKKYLEANKCYPVLINYPYSIKIGNCEVTGTIEVLKEVQNDKEEKELQVCSYITDIHNAQLETLYNLKLNASYIAINEMVDDKNVKIKKRMYNLSRHKETIKSVSTMNKEYVLHSLKTIINQINNKVYFMSPGIKCKTCSYKNKCQNIKFKK